MRSPHLPPARAALALVTLAVSLLALTATAAGAQKVASSPTGASIVEGATRTYNLVLTQPIVFPVETPVELQNVTLALSANEPDRVTISPASVSWPASEWHLPRSMVVTATANAVTGDSGTVTLSGTVVSGAPYYDGYVVQVTFQVVDASPATTTTSAAPATTSTSTSTSTSTTTSTTVPAPVAAALAGAPDAAPQDAPEPDATSGDAEPAVPVATSDSPPSAGSPTATASIAVPSTTTTPAGTSPSPVTIVALDGAATGTDGRPGTPGASVGAARRITGARDSGGMSTLLALAIGSTAGLSCTSLVLATATRPRWASFSRRVRAG